MPDLEIGSGGGVGGIPTKYLLIGAGVLGVGAILLLANRGGGGIAGSGDGGVSPALGPHATLALGSLEATSRQQFGELTESLRDYFAAQGQQIGTGFGDVGQYQAEMQQSILGLYQQQLANAGWSPDQITQWLKDKFPLYGLGTPPDSFTGDTSLTQPVH